MEVYQIYMAVGAVVWALGLFVIAGWQDANNMEGNWPPIWPLVLVAIILAAPFFLAYYAGKRLSE